MIKITDVAMSFVYTSDVAMSFVYTSVVKWIYLRGAKRTGVDG